MQRDERAKVALIGCGGHGRFHLDMLLALADQLELVAVCEKDPRRLKDAAEAAGPQVYATRSLEDLLRRQRPDFAVVATLTREQGPICEQLLRAGIPILCEVPLAFSDEMAKGMMEAADSEELPLAAFENYVFTPLECLKQEAIRAGVFGRIERADVAGCIFHKGHEIALARSYVGWDATPVRVMAHGYGSLPRPRRSPEGIDMPAVVSGVVEFDTGAEAHLFLTGWGPKGPWVPIGGVRNEFHGNEGGYWDGHFRLGREDAPGEAKELELTIRSEQIEGVEGVQELSLDGVGISWQNPFAKRAFPWAEQLPFFPHVDDMPRAWEIASAQLLLNMSQVIAGNATPAYPKERAMVDVRIRLAMLESARRHGDWIGWQEPLEIESELSRFNLYRFLKGFDFRPLPRVKRSPSRGPAIPERSA